MKEELCNMVIEFLHNRTSGGLYPIVAYGVDAVDQGTRLSVLTTNIKDFSLALDTLRDATHEEYNLGRYIPGNRLEAASKENRHVLFYHYTNIERLQPEDFPRLGAVIQAFGAPLIPQKGFALIDLCGFSRLECAEQLSQLYGLTNAVRSAERRCFKFCECLEVRGDFRSAPTGDGFYLWHDTHCGRGDVAVFMLLLCVMTHVEWMRRKTRFPMRLKASYVIDSAYLLFDSAQARAERPAPFNAVGPATNVAARLIEAACPSQILLAEFEKPGQDTEVMTPQTLIRQASELFREERRGAAIIDFDPDKILRVKDKHGVRHYCRNVVGEIPNTVDKTVDWQPVGLKHDDAENIADVMFVGEPGTGDRLLPVR